MTSTKGPKSDHKINYKFKHFDKEGNQIEFKDVIFPPHITKRVLEIINGEG